MVRLPKWLLILLVLTVCVVWIAAFIVGIFEPRYQVPPEINTLFGAIAGGLILGHRRGDDDDE